MLSTSNLRISGCDLTYKGHNSGITKSLHTESICEPALLYVMRCVLPHIEKPFQFLDNLFLDKPNAYVLVTFPNIDWIISQYSFQSLTHDHVNYFSSKGFRLRYKVLQSGDLQLGEFSYVVIQPRASGPTKLEIETFIEYQTQLTNNFIYLNIFKENFLDSISNLKKSIAVYSGAGKGAVLSLNLKLNGNNQVVLDLDKSKNNRFLECTGIQIQSPFISLKDIDFVLVANQNHLAFTRKNLKIPCMTPKMFLFNSNRY